MTKILLIIIFIILFIRFAFRIIARRFIKSIFEVPKQGKKKKEIKRENVIQMEEGQDGIFESKE